MNATVTDVADMLATGCGRRTHVRALFGDVSGVSLMRLAVAPGNDVETLLASDLQARKIGATNPAIDTLLRSRSV